MTADDLAPELTLLFGLSMGNTRL
jgi:hypothetical protein